MLSSRGHKKRTTNFVHLWDEIATAHINRNNSMYGETRVANMYCDLLGLYSGEDNISYLFSIDGYPKELELSYRTTLRSCCEDGVRISFISQMDKYQIDWGSHQLRAKLKTWKIVDQGADNVDEYNLHENLNTLDSQDWRKESLVYLSLAEIRRKRKMFKFRSLMIVSGKRGVNFNTTVKELISLCKAMHIKISRVIGDIPQYLETFSPFSNVYDNKVLSQCGYVVLPDELISRFNTYAQGVIGKSGIYWGTDIYSSFPCLKPVKATTESTENWLITAESGGGKSFFVKGLLYQLLANSDYNGTIMDVEGKEYLPIAEYLSNNDNVVVLNMGEGSGAYYDSTEIVLTGNKDLDRDMKSISTSFTLSLFKTLLGGIGDDEWVDIVINDAISLAYTSRGVSDDMSTWGLSKGLTYYDVYDKLKSLISIGDVGRAVNNMFATSMYAEKAGLGTALTKNDVNRLITSNDKYQEAIETCIAKISRYFEPNGIKANIFSNRIDIGDIIDAKLVVCSFGMEGKTDEIVDPIQMALMQLYAANMSYLRSIFSKHNGKFNFKLWEEFQRWGNFKGSEKTISTAITGGRKMGDINIIITNDISKLLKDDRFSILLNINSFAIGAIQDAQVRETLCKRLSVPEMLPDLTSIANNNKDLSSYVEGDTLLSNPYLKSFLIGLDSTVYTISRMSIPKGLRDSKLFRTGIDLKGDDKKE